LSVTNHFCGFDNSTSPLEDDYEIYCGVDQGLQPAETGVVGLTWALVTTCPNPSGPPVYVVQATLPAGFPNLAPGNCESRRPSRRYNMLILLKFRSLLENSKKALYLTGATITMNATVPIVVSRPSICKSAILTDRSAKVIVNLIANFLPPVPTPTATTVTATITAIATVTETDTETVTATVTTAACRGLCLPLLGPL